MDVLTQIRDAFQDGDDTVKDAALSRAVDEIERLQGEISILREMQRQADAARMDAIKAAFPGLAPAIMHNKS